MTEIDPYYVGAYEHGLIRIYTIDLPPEEVPLFAAEMNVGTADYNWSLKDWLGADPLDETYVTFLDVADLAEVGLIGYFCEGYSVIPADIEAHRAVLDQIKGAAAVITSSAFGGVEQFLNTPAEQSEFYGDIPIHHIATLKEVGAVVTFRHLPDESTKGSLTGDAPQKKPVSDAAMSGRVATIALLVMALLVFLMIKIAG